MPTQRRVTVPQSFTVPDTIEGVAGLLTARKWEKSAIVYAWTLPEESGGRPKSVKKLPLFNISEFADLGITGLTSRPTILAYRNAWVWAVEQGLAQPAIPGKMIELPEGVDFPPTTVTYNRPHTLDAEYQAEADDAGITRDAVRRAAANKAALKAAIKADPEVEQAAWDAIQEKESKKASQRRSDYGVTCPPPVEDTRDSLGDSSFGNQLNAAIEDAGRHDALLEMLSLSQKIRDAVASIKAEHNHTGVEVEIELIHQISHNLSEAQWALAEFTVEQV
jgi:hypothetical protein